MRKNVVRLLALMLLLALLPALALADLFAVVKGGRLNLRDYPSTAARSLGKYDTGTWVLASSANNGWCEVRTLSGKRGYMSANYLDFGGYNGGATVKYANGGYVNIGAWENCEQWDCTTAEGVTVTIVHSDSRDIVLANLENSVVAINVVDFEEHEAGRSRADMEAFADCFDFTAIK